MRASAPAVVVGGGIAGAALAAHLARAGRAVLLVERRPGPHHKVCGEFISSEAALYLDDLDVDLLALGAVRMRAVRLAAERRVAAAPLPFPAFSLSRRVLDETLVRAAAAAGAEVRRGRAVHDIASHAGGWALALDDGSALTASQVFLATGKHDIRGWKRPAGAQHDLVAFKMHWRLSPDQAADLGAGVELALFSGGYAGLEPVEDGIANLCLVVRRKHLAALGPRWELLLAALRAASPHLDRRLAGAVACWNRPLAIASIPYGYIAARNHGPWLLGDQAAVIPSFAGAGIAIALHSARLAADIHLAGGSAAEFQVRLARDVAPQVRRATWMSRMLVHPAGQALAAGGARVAPDLLAVIARMTRIPSECLRNSRDVQLQTA